MNELLRQKVKKYLFIVCVLCAAIFLEMLLGTIGLTIFAIMYLHKTLSISEWGYMGISILCDVFLHYPLGTTLVCITSYIVCVEYLFVKRNTVFVWIIQSLLFVGFYIMIQLVLGASFFSSSQGVFMVLVCLCLYAWTMKRGEHAFIS